MVSSEDCVSEAMEEATENMAANKVGKRSGPLSLVSVVVLVATLLVPSPARASYYEHGVSLTGQIIRDSVPYRLNIKALTAMGGNRLDISLSALQDPAGSTRIRQTQRWSFTLSPGEFSIQDDTYRVNARSDDGSFHADFLVERREGAACSDDQQLFLTVPQGGGLRVETGNDVFGTITELPECGEAYWFSSGPEPGPPPCPLPGHELWGSSLHVKERRSSNIARILVFHSEPLEVAGRPGDWSVKLKGSVPASRFRLDAQLSGSFEGAGLPWLDGTARFEPDGPLERGSWYDCRGEREARTAQRDGAIRGNLTVDVIGSDDQRVNDAEAVALRSRVRPR